MPCCYIIYSSTLDKYYVGSTHESFDSRLASHRSGKYSASYTSQVRDWIGYLAIVTESFKQARRLELEIKRMKSRVYIENLKKYPEIIEKLKTKTSS